MKKLLFIFSLIIACVVMSCEPKCSTDVEEQTTEVVDTISNLEIDSICR